MGMLTLNLFLPTYNHPKTPFVLDRLTVETTESDHRAEIASVLIMRVRGSSVRQLKDALSADLLDHCIWEEQGPKLALDGTDSFHVALLDYPVVLSVPLRSTGERNRSGLTVWPILRGTGLLC